MKEFLKMTLAAIVGFLVVNVVLLFFSFALLGSLAALGSSQPVMPRTAVLTLDMSRIAVSEQTTELDPISQIQGNDISVIGIWDAIQAIDAAAADPAIKYMYMRPDMAAGGIAELEELRTAIDNFRRSGKRVCSRSEVFPAPGELTIFTAQISQREKYCRFSPACRSLRERMSFSTVNRC